MHTLHRLTLTLAAALSLFAAPPAPACPNCKEAAASAIDEGDDPYREARAYNQSIYLMVSMPYLLLGGVGFMVYRGFKKQQSLVEQAAGRAPHADGGKDPACSPPSPDATS